MEVKKEERYKYRLGQIDLEKENNVGKTRDPLGANIKKFLGATERAEREEQVIDAYQKLFHKEEWQRPFNTDGLVLDTLFEMKLDEKLDGIAGHRGLAQCCGYLRKIQLNGVYKKKHMSHQWVALA